MAHRTAPASTSQQLSTSSFHYCRAPTKSLVQWTHCGHRWRSLSEFLECWMRTRLEKLTHSLKSNHNSKHGKIFTFSLRKALKLSSPIGTWPPPTDWARPTTIIPTFTWPLFGIGQPEILWEKFPPLIPALLAPPIAFHGRSWGCWWGISCEVAWFANAPTAFINCKNTCEGFSIKRGC